MLEPERQQSLETAPRGSPVCFTPLFTAVNRREISDNRSAQERRGAERDSFRQGPLSACERKSNGVERHPGQPATVSRLDTVAGAVANQRSSDRRRVNLAFMVAMARDGTNEIWQDRVGRLPSPQQ